MKKRIQIREDLLNFSTFPQLPQQQCGRSPLRTEGRRLTGHRQSGGSFSTSCAGQRHRGIDPVNGVIFFASCISLAIAFEHVDVAQTRCLPPVWCGNDNGLRTAMIWNAVAWLKSGAENGEKHHHLITRFKLSQNSFVVVTLFH